ncbi:MAG: 5'/3'-nucleotidase SurE [Rikenellaceae bacterium]
MKRERLILVTNDDGYKAKGFEALIEVASKFGRVVAVAPRDSQSGASQAITVYNPLYLDTIRKNDNIEIYSLSGTPVDCVKFAADYMLHNQKIDLVLSGINHGTNAGPNILYSGTMGAAIEGHFYAPSIGFSLDNHTSYADFDAAKIYAEKIIYNILNSNIDYPLCLNVNIPDLPAHHIKGIKVRRQNRGFWREKFVARTDPRGREYFWLTGAFENSEVGATDSDIAAMESGYVAVVPVNVDMTSYTTLERLAPILETV